MHPVISALLIQARQEDVARAVAFRTPAPRRAGRRGVAGGLWRPARRRAARGGCAATGRPAHVS